MSDEERRREYHHLGIPTTEVREGERYLGQFGMHVSGFETNPFGIEWMRFEPGSTVPDLVQRVPHVAFRVPDLEAAIEGHELLIEPNSPSPGIRVAFIVSDGAPVEFLEIDDDVVAGGDDATASGDGAATAPPGAELPRPTSGNLFAAVAPQDGEVLEDLLAVGGTRVERIVSKGEASPPGFWYDQSEAEWVVLLAGAAGLQVEGEPRARELGPGDWLFLPPHCRHRVEWTAPDAETVWLAVFVAGRERPDRGS